MFKNVETHGKPFLLCCLIGLYLVISINFLKPLEYFKPAILPQFFWTEDGWLNFSPRQDKLVLNPALKVGASLNQELLYGLVRENDLPWAKNMPVDLNDLRTRYGANLFINAFRTTLPDPILAEEHNVAIAANYLAGKVIMPDEIFSLNKSIGPRTTTRGFGPGPIYTNGVISSTTGGGICKVATTIYNLIIHSDLPVIERHPHSMPVPYVPPGRDATLLWGVKDVRFLNNKEHPLIIWAQVQNGTLYIALYGQYDPPLVEWETEVISKIPTWTIRRKNSTLAPGETLLISGLEGMTVKTWINVDYRANLPQRKYLGQDYYRPLSNYLEYGP